ncbi:hypothetical protein MCELHM10_02485 [Paracoccaceae bacterium]
MGAKSEFSERILTVLDDLAVTLESVGEGFWSKKAREALCVSDPEVLQRMCLNWFGGMGSLNDVLLSSLNGHIGTLTELRRAQKALDEIRSRLYSSL